MAGIQQNSGSVYNSLTAGSKIVGAIVTDSNIRVDGTIEGDVTCAGKLVIGERGLIVGTVVCENAEIMGTLDGKIEAKQSLAMRATSRVKGEMKTHTLIIEPNAIFNGVCTMGKDATKTEISKPSK